MKNRSVREALTMAKILIVDDEPRIRDLIRAHLEHEGFSCEEARRATADTETGRSASSASW